MGSGLDRLLAIGTGLSQLGAERKSTEANQGIFGGLGQLLTGMGYDPSASIKDQIAWLTNSGMGQLGWNNGQIGGTLSDLQKIQSGALVNTATNQNLDVAGFNNMANQMGRSLSDYGQQMGLAARGYASDLASAYRQPYQNAMGYANQMGAQQQADIRQNYASANAANQMSLARGGMGTTTLGSAMRTGNTREQQSDLNRLAESLAGQKMNIESTLGTNLANAMGQGYGARYGVATDLANQTRGLADWRSQGSNALNQTNRYGLSGLIESQGREMLDTRGNLSGALQNLIYSPNVSAADQSGAVNAATQYGYHSVPPWTPSFMQSYGAPLISMAATEGMMLPFQGAAAGWWGGGGGGGGYTPSLVDVGWGQSF